MTKAWLRDLEERVREASEQLKQLRSLNKKLQHEVRQLEGRLAAAPSGEESSAWAEERDDIRQRVESLVDHLDGLLRE